MRIDRAFVIKLTDNGGQNGLVNNQEDQKLNTAD